MSGYPYGTSSGGYSSLYDIDNSGYSNYPPNNHFQPSPPIPMCGDNQPPQQYGGVGNMQHQPTYSQGPPSSSSAEFYPTLSTSAAPSNYGEWVTGPTNQSHYQQPSISLASLEQYQGKFFLH